LQQHHSLLQSGLGVSEPVLPAASGSAHGQRWTHEPAGHLSTICEREACNLMSGLPPWLYMCRTVKCKRQFPGLGRHPDAIPVFDFGQTTLKLTPTSFNATSSSFCAPSKASRRADSVCCFKLSYLASTSEPTCGVGGRPHCLLQHCTVLPFFVLLCCQCLPAGTLHVCAGVLQPQLVSRGLSVDWKSAQ
jgi:hypothetical protein